MEFKAFISELFYLHLFCFSLAYKNHLHTKCNFFFPRLPQIPSEPGYGRASNGFLLLNDGVGFKDKKFYFGGSLKNLIYNVGVCVVLLRRVDTPVHPM